MRFQSQQKPGLERYDLGRNPRGPSLSKAWIVAAIALIVTLFLVTLIAAATRGEGSGHETSPPIARVEPRTPPPASPPVTPEIQPTGAGLTVVPEDVVLDEGHRFFEEPAHQPADPQSAITEYREAFNRVGAPLVRTVDRLQGVSVPSSIDAECRELTRQLDSFADQALPAPFEQLSFSLSQAVARYREAAKACERRDFAVMRYRLQMGTTLWKRSTADMTAILAGDLDVLASRPTSVADAFADLPAGPMPLLGQSYEERSGSSSREAGSGGGSRPCCKVCVKGKPCGNTCISRSYTCRQPPGCAC